MYVLIYPDTCTEMPLYTGYKEPKNFTDFAEDCKKSNPFMEKSHTFQQQKTPPKKQKNP